jgi:glyoxylase-like metal-dependent hydrolase (beta-lactamase superfamily II)
MKRPAVRTLRPGLHLLEAEVEDFDVRAALLIGQDRAVMWDTLAHPAQMEGVVGFLARLRGGAGAGDEPRTSFPLTVVYSHSDWDHAWGTCALGDAEAVVAHTHAAERFRTDVPAELEARRGREPGVWDVVRLVPPTVLFERTHAVSLGGATLELHALPGHTADCIVGFVPEWGVLLAGDTVETPLPVVNNGASVAGWAEKLERWLNERRVTTVVPSHGLVGGSELLADNVRYLRGLSAGKGPAVPSALSPFYRDTHRRNLELAGSRD